MTYEESLLKVFPESFAGIRHYFAFPEPALSTVNREVEELTHGHIKGCVSVLTEEMSIALVRSAYFNGQFAPVTYPTQLTWHSHGSEKTVGGFRYLVFGARREVDGFALVQCPLLGGRRMAYVIPPADCEFDPAMLTEFLLPKCQSTTVVGAHF